MAKKNNKRGFFGSVREYYLRVVMFFRSHNVQFVMGLLFVAFAIFLCSSFISFFVSGGSDQTALEAVANEAVGNTSGRGCCG